MSSHQQPTRGVGSHHDHEHRSDLLSSRPRKREHFIGNPIPDGADCRAMTTLPRSDQPERGQVLPLFALFLVVLAAFSALAIDVSSAYASQRAYREAADAASLAGGQDLQTTTRAITSANQLSARQHAYQILRDRLNA